MSISPAPDQRVDGAHATGQGPHPAPESTEPQVLTSARQSVLRVLRRHAAPMTVDETARECRLHNNTVRTHLDALVEAGFARRFRAPITGRGRPAWCYEATVAGTEAGSEYAALAVALADQVGELPEARSIAHAAGVAWGRSLQRDSPVRQVEHQQGPRDRLREGLDQMGFAPEDETDHGGRPSGDALVLRQCPMLDAAQRVPHVVCTVHQGLAAALVESAGGDPGSVQVEPFSVPGGCRVVLAADATEPDPRRDPRD
ncbi:helix-turn-helix transcriptional regulator [Arsenicicoccus sp. oral taxon 190]|uniref:helix-turn-helix transcriptional regulator n=1 Tax=Arsenicicoccus sp. oral taxon 190 TaxID=1658671 RepID=UPI0012E30F20|nr:helix-turn-helix domain-containing protein [Arsenicicoccus sp. oral taxon 190]